MQRYQEGCLQKTKRKNGVHVWTFRWYDMTGETRAYRKRVIGTLAEMPTRKDAEKELVQLRQNINSSVVVPETVGGVITHYCEKELVPERKSFGTIEANKTYLKLHVEPRWGEMLLSSVRTVDVEEWLGSLRYAPGTRAKIRNLMSAVFSHAIRYELISRNPITGVRTSAKRMREPDVLTPAEFSRLLDELGLRDRALVILAGSTGLRRSELVALTWADIDFVKMLVNVRRSCVRNHFGDTKTEASRKPVPMHSSVLQALNVWRSESPYSGDEDFIFPSYRLCGRQPLSPDTLLKKVIRPALERAGVVGKTVGFHTFRHSLATNLGAIGVDLKTAQELLRHANSRITMDIYTQAISANKRAANDNVMELMLASGH